MEGLRIQYTILKHNNRPKIFTENSTTYTTKHHIQALQHKEPEEKLPNISNEFPKAINSLLKFSARLVTATVISL